MKMVKCPGFTFEVSHVKQEQHHRRADRKGLGISIKTWDKIELTSLGLLVLITLRETMDVVVQMGYLALEGGISFNGTLSSRF